MYLDVAYHWSPTENRVSIMRDGLKPYSNPTVHTGDLAYDYICLGFSPLGAWSLSGGMDWMSEIEEWDLWEVRLKENDELHIRPEFGNSFQEIKCRSALPSDRVKFVAKRVPNWAIDPSDPDAFKEEKK